MPSGLGFVSVDVTPEKFAAALASLELVKPDGTVELCRIAPASTAFSTTELDSLGAETLFLT